MLRGNSQHLIPLININRNIPWWLNSLCASFGRCPRSRLTGFVDKQHGPANGDKMPPFDGQATEQGWCWNLQDLEYRSVNEIVTDLHILTSERLDENDDEWDVHSEAGSEEDRERYAESPILIPDRPRPQRQDNCTCNIRQTGFDTTTCLLAYFQPNTSRHKITTSWTRIRSDKLRGLVDAECDLFQASIR